MQFGVEAWSLVPCGLSLRRLKIRARHRPSTAEFSIKIALGCYASFGFGSLVATAIKVQHRSPRDCSSGLRDKRFRPFV